MTTYATAERARQKAIAALRAAGMTEEADRLAACLPITDRETAAVAYATEDAAYATEDAAYAGERHAGVDTATAVLHQHVWQYRGMTPGGLLVMVCDGHPEPVVRLVRATVEDDR